MLEVESVQRPPCAVRRCGEPVSYTHLNDEITLCSLVSSDPSRMALICYSFLVKSFDDVAILTIDGLPKDFHKVYLIYRNDKNRLKRCV